MRSVGLHRTSGREREEIKERTGSFGLGNKRKQVDEAFNIMTTCINEMQQELKPTKNEHLVYGECVAYQIRKIKKSHVTA